MNGKFGEPWKTAFEDLVREMSPPMIRTASFLTRDSALGKDLAQEALVRTYKHWDRAQESPKAYVWAALLNLCRDQYRRQVRRGDVLGEVAEVLVHPAQTPVADEAIDRVQLIRVLNLLAPQAREVIVLRYLVGLSVIEVADVLNLPQGTVKSTASRALDTLRQSLGAPEKEVKNPC